MGFLREPSHIIILLVVVLLLFGSRRLPDMARGLGQSMRIFKSEVKQMKEDDADKTREGGSARAGDPEPLEGKVLRDDQARANEVRRDA
jgi:sec-independent protein translocase protein TatA